MHACMHACVSLDRPCHRSSCGPKVVSQAPYICSTQSLSPQATVIPDIYHTTMPYLLSFISQAPTCHWRAQTFSRECVVSAHHSFIVQVNGGHFSNDEDCQEACKQLAVKLGQNQAPSRSSFRVLAGQTSTFHACCWVDLGNNVLYGFCSAWKHLHCFDVWPAFGI